MTKYREYLTYLLRQIIFTGALALLSSSSFAGIYKWVDADGTVHYGQQRPTNAPSEKMQVQRYAPVDKSTYKRPSTSTQKPKGENTPADKKSADAEPEKKKETKAEKKRRLAACDQARKNLSTMEAIGRVRSVDKDGNTTYLSQQQKEDRMSRNRDLISKHCK